MATAKKYVTILEDPKPKNKVTRYDCADVKAALGNAYVRNSVIEALGNPAKIKITVEAA